MSKRNIAYIKPDEPSFIKRLKQEAGYKEGPTIKTKFQTQHDTDDDLSDTENEKPQVVVLSPTDLTEEEANAEIRKKEKELENEPADLNKRIVFKSKKKTEKSVDSQDCSKEKIDISKKKKSKSSLLSFADDDDEDDQNSD